MLDNKQKEILGIAGYTCDYLVKLLDDLRYGADHQQIHDVLLNLAAVRLKISEILDVNKE